MRDYSRKYNEIIENPKHQATIKRRHEGVNDSISIDDFIQETYYKIWLDLINKVGYEDLRTINEKTVVMNATTKVIRETLKEKGLQRGNEIVEETTEHYLVNGKPASKPHPEKEETVFTPLIEVGSIEKYDIESGEVYTSDIPYLINGESIFLEDEDTHIALESITSKLKDNDIPFFLDMLKELPNTELQKKYSMSPSSVSNKKKSIKKKIDPNYEEKYGKKKKS